MVHSLVGKSQPKHIVGIELQRVGRLQQQHVTNVELYMTANIVPVKQHWVDEILTCHLQNKDSEMWFTM